MKPSTDWRAPRPTTKSGRHTNPLSPQDKDGAAGHPAVHEAARRAVESRTGGVWTFVGDKIVRVDGSAASGGVVDVEVNDEL